MGTSTNIDEKLTFSFISDHLNALQAERTYAAVGWGGHTTHSSSYSTGVSVLLRKRRTVKQVAMAIAMATSITIRIPMTTAITMAIKMDVTMEMTMAIAMEITMAIIMATTMAITSATTMAITMAIKITLALAMVSRWATLNIQCVAQRQYQPSLQAGVGLG